MNAILKHINIEFYRSVYLGRWQFKWLKMAPHLDKPGNLVMVIGL